MSRGSQAKTLQQDQLKGFRVFFHSNMRTVKASLHAQFVSQKNFSNVSLDKTHNRQMVSTHLCMPWMRTSHPYANETTWHLLNPNEVHKCTESGRARSGAEGEGRLRAYLAGRQRWFLDGGLAQGSTQA